MKKSIQNWLKLAALGLLLSVTGCGQKGELYRTNAAVITITLPASCNGTSLT